MIELELLGANGDTIVMTDGEGQRYSVLVDDALRAAVRRARPAALRPAPAAPAPGSALPPRELQALMRAGATAQEVATSTGMDVESVRRFEGPVLAEREWAVAQAQACRIGWEKDSPVLGELVVDRLATRGVEPASLEWDAVREGREPWQVVLTFVQGAEEKQARWELDLTARSVSALDEESHWLTESATGSRRPAVFDQDSSVSGASAGPDRVTDDSAASRRARAAGASQPAQPTQPAHASPASPARAVAPAASPAPAASSSAPDAGVDGTEALLADLASNRGRRVEVDMSEEDRGEGGPAGSVLPQEEPGHDAAPGGREATVVSMSERRRAMTGNHPAGSRLRRGATPGRAGSGASAGTPGSVASVSSSPSAGSAATGAQRALAGGSDGETAFPGPASPNSVASASTGSSPVFRNRGASAPTSPTAEVPTQDALPEMPEGAPARPKRKARRSVPSWDEIVFGAKPE